MVWYNTRNGKKFIYRIIQVSDDVWYLSVAWRASAWWNVVGGRTSIAMRLWFCLYQRLVWRKISAVQNFEALVCPIVLCGCCWCGATVHSA